MKYLLMGNPNVGKTTLFNNLTGAIEVVGNFAGVTVDYKKSNLKSAFLKDNNITEKVNIIDLPGLYSINPLSSDENVVTKYLVEEECNGFINVVESSTLRKSLGLTIQLLETNSPMTIALNMSDEAKNKGVTINKEKLSEYLGIDLIETVATKNEGLNNLVATALKQKSNNFKLEYSDMIEYGIEKLIKEIPDNKLNKRFIAIQMLEDNNVIIEYVKGLNKDIINTLETVRQDIYKLLNSKDSDPYDIKLQISFDRRDYITKIIRETFEVKQSMKLESGIQNKVDTILTNKITGIPVFILIMGLIYFLTFNFIGAPLQEIFEEYFTLGVTDNIATLLGNIGFEEGHVVNTIVIEGVFAGIGVVASFLPLMLVFFFFMEILKSTGYLSRVAIMFDSIFVKFGISGKAIISVITGYGCVIPAIASTRIIENKRERNSTIMMLPFISCGGSMIVFTVFAAAFFPTNLIPIILLLLQIGTLLIALLSAKIFGSTFFKKDKSTFVIEVPKYRLPKILSLLKATLNSGWEFIRRIITFLVIGTLIITILSVLGPTGVVEDTEDSFLKIISTPFALLLIPLGLGTWQAFAAFASGFAARELSAISLVAIYALGDDVDLEANSEALKNVFSVPQGVSFLLLSILFMPCFAALGAMFKETKSKKLSFISLGVSFAVAYIVAMIAFQVLNIIY